MPKKMKLPNGFGNINKLSGERRNPYRARVAVEYLDDGKRIWHTVGYYPRYKDALQALADYHRDPFSLGGEVTFAEVYEQWAKEKYEKIAAITAGTYKSSYTHCKAIYDVSIKDIKLKHMQDIINSHNKGCFSKLKIKNLLSQVFAYAVKHDIISKDNDKTEYIDVGKKTESKKHYKFTSEEVEALWKNAEHNEYAQMILMMIYSGARPGEFLAIKKEDVNLAESFFEIHEGKNEFAKRKVPIHYRVIPFYENWLKKPGDHLITKKNGKRFNLQGEHTQFVDGYWEPVLKEIGILTYKDSDGEEQNHLPHDTRHTFTSMWKEKKLDETFRRKIQGHSGQGIGEKVYTHIDVGLLRSELDKL